MRKPAASKINYVTQYLSSERSNERSSEGRRRKKWKTKWNERWIILSSLVAVQWGASGIDQRRNRRSLRRPFSFRWHFSFFIGKERAKMRQAENGGAFDRPTWQTIALTRQQWGRNIARGFHDNDDWQRLVLWTFVDSSTRNIQKILTLISGNSIVRVKSNERLFSDLLGNLRRWNYEETRLLKLQEN